MIDFAAACPYLAGCHPHHGAGFGPGAPVPSHGVHVSFGGTWPGLGGALFLVIIGLLYALKEDR